MDTFESHGIHIPYRRTSGKLKLVCPECRKEGKRAHPNDRSLSVDLDQGLWNCHYCGFSGKLKDRDHTLTFEAQRRYTVPTAMPHKKPSQGMLEWFGKRGISPRTLEACGVDQGTEVMPQDGKPHGVVRFRYMLDGKLVNCKYRDKDKDFKMIPGAELIPWNIDSIAGAAECVITEGEIDALSYVEAGFPTAISVPAGANSNLGWLDQFFADYIEDKETVYIAADSDRAGETLRSELVRRIGPDRCRLVSYGEGCKDANEHLVKFGKESLLDTLRLAAEIPVPGLRSLPDYKTQLDDIWMNGFHKGRTIGLPDVDKAITFETGRLCVVTGIPSSGKSELVDEVCVRLNRRFGYKVGYFSPENMPLAYHARKIMEKLFGSSMDMAHMSPDDYEKTATDMGENFFHICPEGLATVDEVLDLAAVLVRRRGIRILVVDPYNRLESAQVNGQSETQYVSVVLDKLTAFAQRYDVLVILVAHPRKMLKGDTDDGVPTAYHINGSANFFNKADYGFTVHRDRKKEEAKDGTPSVLMRVWKVKFRHMGQGGDSWLRFNTCNGRYTGGSTDGIYRDDTHPWIQAQPDCPAESLPCEALQQFQEPKVKASETVPIPTPFGQAPRFLMPTDNEAPIPF